MERSFSRRRLIGATLAGAAVAPSLGAHAQGATKVLRSRSISAIEVLDPAFRIGSYEDDIMRAILRGLVTVKGGDEWGHELDLAEEIVQESPTRVRFRVKRGQMWSGGFGEITADDVKFSFERIADPDTKSPYRVDWEQLDKVEVTGSHEGVIILKKPFMPLWTTSLPAGSGLIVCRKAVEAMDGKRFTINPGAVSGPYRIREIEPRRHAILERNPVFTGPRPEFDEIRSIVVIDSNAAELAFDAGELDFTIIPVASVARLRSKPPANGAMIVRPSLAYWWLGLQSEAGPFADPRVRKAVQHAVDVEQVLEGAFFGVAPRATGIIAPGILGNRPKNIIDKPDLAQARRLLAEAGVREIRAELLVRNSAEFVAAAEIIAASLAQVGMKIDVTPMDPSALRAIAIDKGDGWKRLHMTISRFSMQPDPAWATAWFTADQVGKWNYEHFRSDEYDRLNAEAIVETDTAKRGRMYQRMQDIMEESGSYIFLTHGVNAVVHRKTIKPALTPDAQRSIWTKFTPA